MRSCRKPPVRAPAAMEFQGSSLWRTATSVQSKVEKRPPHTAKLPPIRGASLLIACLPNMQCSTSASHSSALIVGVCGCCLLPQIGNLTCRGNLRPSGLIGFLVIVVLGSPASCWRLIDCYSYAKIYTVPAYACTWKFPIYLSFRCCHDTGNGTHTSVLRTKRL